MKTAISLPDAVFRAAERQAKRSQKSRSQLYADALAEYLSRHAHRCDEPCRRPACQGGWSPEGLGANASQLFAVDRTYLSRGIGKLAPKRLEQILASIDVVLGR